MKTKALILMTVVWIAVAVTAYFAGASGRKVEVRSVDKIVEITKTNVVKVPVEVVKEVPASIPREYLEAKAFLETYLSPRFAAIGEGLLGMTNFSVVVVFDDNSRDVLEYGPVKESVELAMRRNGIKLLPAGQSAHTLFVSVGCVYKKTSSQQTYHVSVEVNERVPIWRGNQFISSYVTTWSDFTVGHVGMLGAPQSIKDAIDTLLVKFSNAYLKANEK